MDAKRASIIFGIYVLGIATGIVGTVLLASRVHNAETRVASIEPIGTSTHLSDVASTYRNTAYGISLDYPSELAVYEYDEGDGARTIVFEKTGEDFGFQIFLTPYSSDTISIKEIQREIPSLEIENAEATTVGAATPALAFASKAPGMDATRELWFVHLGYLFQVTTYPALANWLTEIFATLHFSD